MSLVERISEDIKVAMKSRDELRVSVLRLIRSSIKYKVIAKRTDGHDQSADELDDAGVIDVLSSLAKQREESVSIYKQHGQPDRAKKEESELSIIREYMPAQLEIAELEKIIRDAIQKLGAASPKDMGKVMQAVVPQIKGRADGKIVSELVKKCLTNQS